MRPTKHFYIYGRRRYMISKRGLAAILTVAITSSAMMPAAAAETTAELSDIAVQAPMSDEGVSETGDEIPLQFAD